ncbi:MAG: helix-hairpin-helix domain-containing protein [Desulfobacter sp.]
MGRLAEEMIRLKTEVDQLKTHRQSFMNQLTSGRAQLRSEVADLTGQFKTERMKRHAGVREELSAFRAGLIGYVDDLEQKVTRMTKEFHRDMDDIRQARQHRSAEVGEIRRSVSDLVEASRRERLEQAAELRQGLAAFRHQIMAQARDVAEEGKAERHAAVTGLRQTVADMTDTFRRELEDLSQQGRESRGDFVANIRESVSGMMQEMSRFRSDLINDLNTMRRVWQNDAGPAPEAPGPRTAPAPSAPPPETAPRETALDSLDDPRDNMEPVEYLSPAPEPEPEPVPGPAVEDDKAQAPAGAGEPAPEKEGDGDDLSLISGIGPERHKQLKATGIHTFARLAAADADALYETLNRQVGRAAITLWIDQARELNF